MIGKTDIYAAPIHGRHDNGPGSIENGWKEVYEIEPDIVKEAAKKIPSAKEFLKGLE